MTYEASLREMFQGIDLQVEDIYLLERFQIAYLPDRVPQREFAALLWANTCIKRFLATKYPPIAGFIEDVLVRYGPAADQQELDAYSDRLVWEIADHLMDCSKITLCFDMRFASKIAQRIRRCF